jgi:hypothetical protein
VQLGVRFTSTVAGNVTGVRFYKGPTDTGVHTASLWSSTGSLLATGTLPSESASGWQELTFATPVPIQAGVEYRASYYTTSGVYAVDPNALTNAVTNGALSTIANGGVYSYSNGFPDQVVSHNYWADVDFAASP